MAELTLDPVVLFVPLLLGIVSQLSSLARDTVEEPSEWEQPPLLLPFSKNSLLPSLGRLNYLHATNYLLLLMCFILVVAFKPEDGHLVKNLLGLIVLLVWLQLPLLEIDEYGAIVNGEPGGDSRDEENWNARAPWSLYLHIVATVAVAVYVVTLFPAAEILTEVDLFSPELESFLNLIQLFHQGGLVILLTVAVAGFLWLFEQEVEAVNGEEQPTEKLSDSERPAEE